MGKVQETAAADVRTADAQLQEVEAGRHAAARSTQDGDAINRANVETAKAWPESQPNPIDRA